MKSKLIIFLLSFLLFKPSVIISQRYTNESQRNTLRIGEFLAPSIINPILTHSTISASLKGIVFDGLIKLNEKMEPNPHLALFWENSADGLRWIFYLRKDVKFHDGVELTAEDVKFTFDKILDPSINSPFISMFKSFKSVNVKNRYTVEIDLKNPSLSLPFYLDVGILPKHLLIGKDLRKAEFNYHPIGTGPFKTESWSKDEIILKANEDYFKGKAHLNKVIVKFFRDQRVVWAELMRGTVDCVFLTSSKNYDIIEKVPEFKVYSFLVPCYDILTFNQINRYFDQREVRKALNYAVDKERIVTKVLKGKGRSSCGTIYPQSWAYDKAIEPYPYDPKKALDLLNSEGWEDTNRNHILDRNGREFEFALLIVKEDDVSRECALLIQQQLLDIGIVVNVKSLPFPIYKNSLLTKRFDAALLSIFSDDPDKNYLWWHSSQINEGFNVFSYRNEKVDELLDRGRSTLCKEERIRIYHQFQRKIHDDPPGVFLFWRDYLIVIHKRFRGISLNPLRILSNINEWYVPKEEQKYR